MIGVGITVHDRPDVAAVTIAHWRDMLPEDTRLVVVDDGSRVPFPGADRRHDEARGVAAAKNACLALLDGCEHLFLADDDVWPTASDWWQPYTACEVPHLSYQWDGRVRGSGPGWVAKSTFHGCLLYVRRNVLDRVGGMRPEFGRFGYEHVEWSRRIHAAGLTPYRYCDVPDSTALWWSLDEHARRGELDHMSSLGRDRRRMAAGNLPLLDHFTGTTDYVDFWR